MASSEKQPALKTPIGMASFVYLAEARKGEKKDQKAKFRMCIVWTPALLKKYNGKAALKALMASALAAGETRFGANFRSRMESGKLNWPFRFLDDEDEDTSYTYPEGSIWIQPSTVGRPGVADRYEDPNNPGRPIIIPIEEIEEKVYAGCLVRASVVAYAYDRDGNKGVAFALNNVQKVGEGERIDGRKKATDEFEALEDAADMDDEDAPPKRRKSRVADDEDEDNTPPKRRRRPVEDDDDEDEPPRRAKKRRPVEDDDDDDEEDETPKRRKSRAVEEDDDEDEDDNLPPRSRAKPETKKRRTLDDLMD